jgi:hypothetical protein
MKIVPQMLPAHVYGHSLVKITFEGGDPVYPYHFGNYFWFPVWIRCVNMWKENLEEARRRFLPDEQVQAEVSMAIGPSSSMSASRAIGC